MKRISIFLKQMISSDEIINSKQQTEKIDPLIIDLLNTIDPSNSITLWSTISIKNINSYKKYTKKVELFDIFKSVGLKLVSPGYNPGTNRLKISFQLPHLKDFNYTLKQTFIWFMLGIHPLQKLIEKRASYLMNPSNKINKHNDKDDIDIPLIFSSNEPLVNKCLKYFSQCTKIAITNIDLNLSALPIADITITIDSIIKDIKERSTNILYTDQMYTLYLFHSSYLYFHAYNLNTNQWDTLLLKNLKKKLIKQMIKTFWSQILQLQYFASDLFKKISNILTMYLNKSINNSQAIFIPNDFLSIYLYGIAGIGKSLFIPTFTQALKYIISYYIETNKRIEFIRIPLNAVSADVLARILRVKGISDWSIERILEQIICKGGIAILHLEENPQDVIIQQQLFTLIHQMVINLLNKYPEYRNNIIYLITSNYKPCNTIKSNMITMYSPTATIRKLWCQTYIYHHVSYKLHIKQLKIIIDDNIFGSCNDMRKIGQLRLSITYHILSYLSTYKKNRTSHQCH